MTIGQRKLGRTGLNVSEVSLGTMAFGRWIDQKESADVLNAALEAGITLIDTADVYGSGMDKGNPLEIGESETILGHLLGERRHRIVWQPKFMAEWVSVLMMRAKAGITFIARWKIV
ncbi:aryl-alcohol dehydrogenase-like predicted oxidoreductase [Paenibacillus sp. V4I7]|nr:aryl-alcohol dehydrogenase-like predicted oxidoreductase [Paenibacillus sp. V4I7]